MAGYGTSTAPRDAGNTHALACGLTAVGGGLFLLGMLHLIAVFLPSVGAVFIGVPGDHTDDPSGASTCLRLAGWFVSSGWLVAHFRVARRAIATVWGGRRLQRVAALLSVSGDGILEMLLGGLFFIILLIAGLVSLWSGTIH
jgi:hypothetical protein